MKSVNGSIISRACTWYRTRKQRKKEKEEKEPTLESTPIKVFALVMTLASMMLGLSLMPLFPQPLPIFISFLVAFVTFKSPKYGMPIGSLLIGFGLIYRLSVINFIAMLGEPLVRASVIIILLFLFAALPFRFHRCKDAIAIDMGIIAAILLFFHHTYYLAIPLILTAIVLFKRSSSLTVTYYVLISVPLQIMQYSKTISQITRTDWWVDPAATPPLYVPLAEIFKDIQASIAQFRLYETAKIIDTIAGQITSTPSSVITVRVPWIGTTVTGSAALLQYADSFPGILLFLIVVVGVIWATAFLARSLVKGNATETEKLLPAVTAAIATALFFICLNGLQGPLAFRAEINGVQILIATFAAVAFTIPAFLVSYTPKKKATNEMIMEKARELMEKLQVFEELLNKVKSNIPVNVSLIEGKMQVTKDKLNDVLSKTSARFYDLSELDEKFNELDPGISNEINNLMLELDVMLGEHQIRANCEYSAWMGKFKDIGLEVKNIAKIDFQKELPLEMRVNCIKQVLEGGQSLATEVISVAEQIYDIIRSLYDPNLPEKSQTIAFAKQKLDEKTAPWFAIDALFIAFNNWEKQYSAEISKSVEYLQNSLTYIVNLSTQNERLLPVLGNNFSKMIDCAKRAEDIRIGIEKKALNVMNVMVIRDALQSSLNIAGDVLSILYEELRSREESIESLLPTKDYLWGKNTALRERMSSAVEIICGSSSYGPKQVMENLPIALSYIDECVVAIALYDEKKEFLLNYPIAEAAIENLFGQKKQISSEDLPFEPKYAEEYLRLFYIQRYHEFSFDETNMLLKRRA